MLPNLKRYLVVILSGLLGLGVFLHMRGCDKRKDNIASGLVLAPNESEAVIVDPLRHQITLVTETHTKSFTLPDRPSRISVLKGDGVKIVSPQYGNELRPFLGVAYTLDGGTVLGGADIFYWKRLDIGLGLSIDPHLVQYTQAFVGFSFAAYSNCSVGIGLANKLTPLLFVKVRL